MKVITLDKNGINTPVPTIYTTSKGKRAWQISHGEEGRGRWQVRYPLSIREFPVPDTKGDPNPMDISGVDFSLFPLNRKDKRDNPLYLLVKSDGAPTTAIKNGFLVLWSLSPGFRGSASYAVEGEAKEIASGEEAQGAAGRAGGAECPVIHVTGPCKLSWHRTGRLYGGQADWIAVYDGQRWVVGPDDGIALDDAAENY